MPLLYNELMQEDAPQGSQSSAPNQPAPVDDPSAVSWSASEYVHHEKQAGWYAIFGAIIFFLAVLLYLATKDLFGPISIVVLAAAFWVYAARPPRTLEYQIDSGGITIAQKRYPYTDFRSFSIIQDGGVMSLQLNPLKRFLPAIDLFFSPDQIDGIADALGQYLPHEDKDADAIDKLARYFRF